MIKVIILATGEELFLVSILVDALKKTSTNLNFKIVSNRRFGASQSGNGVQGGSRALNNSIR